MHLVQCMVGLNGKLTEKPDKKGHLESHHAVQTCPEACDIEHLMSVYLQGLIALDAEGCLPLHHVMAFNFRPGAMKHFFNTSFLCSMNCCTNSGGK